MQLRFKIKKSRIHNSIILLFFLICILFNSGYGYNLVVDSLALYSLFALAVIVFIRYGIQKKDFLRIKFWKNPLAVLGVGVLLIMIFHFDFNSWGSYIRQFLILFIALLLARNISFRKFTSVFVSFMVIVTTVSILAWFIVNILGLGLPLPIMKSSAENIYYNTYYNGFLFFINTYTPIRLMGPFWEPGVYSSMAIFALILYDGGDLEIDHRKSILTTVLLSLGIILSFSTAGYILLVLTFTIKYIEKSGYKVRIIATTILFISACVLLLYSNQILLLLSTWLPNLFGKLVNEGSRSRSTRLFGPLLDLRIFSNNIVLGAGMTKYIMQWPQLAKLMDVESRTSTITYFLANYGIIGGIYIFTVIRGILRQKKMLISMRIILLIILVAILSKEPHYVNLLTTIILVYLNSELLYKSEKVNL